MTADTLRLLSAVNDCQVSEMEKSGKQMDPNHSDSCQKFWFHVRDVQSAIIYTYKLIAFSALREPDPKDAAMLWQEMSNFCQKALTVLSSLKDRYPLATRVPATGMRILPDHESEFPLLAISNYRKTSEESIFYNCVAWAMGEQNSGLWWDPEPRPECYWPPGIPRGWDTNTFIKLFSIVGGYSPCASAAPEAGVQKVAIYESDLGEFTHVARQAPGGHWTSKLGDWEDIEHSSLEALEGVNYGRVAAVLSRQST